MIGSSPPFEDFLFLASTRPLTDVLHVGVRAGASERISSSLPHYVPFLLDGVALAFQGAFVRLAEQESRLVFKVSEQFELRREVEEEADAHCILSSQGLTFYPSRGPVRVALLEVVAENETAMRGGRARAVFLRLEGHADLFVHACSVDGLEFGKADEYGRFLSEVQSQRWERRRWEGEGPWIFTDGRVIPAESPRP